MRASSTKQQAAAENNRGTSDRASILHQRLSRALALGSRSFYHGSKKWYSADIEIQRLVVRSIDAYLDCISTSHHASVKDSIADMIGALESILNFKSKSVLKLALKVAVKMVNVLPGVVFESHLIDFVRLLSSLLHSRETEVAHSGAVALNLVMPRLNSKTEREVWKVFKEACTVDVIINRIQDFFHKNKPNIFLQEMVSLLSKTLWHWPHCRFCVYNDDELLEVLVSIAFDADFSLKAVILQLYSMIALCCYGAQKLLENGEPLLQLMVRCMDDSNPHFVRVEGFKLAEYFMTSEGGLSKVMKICGEPIIKAIFSALINCSLDIREVDKNQTPLLVELRLLATITHFDGKHHDYIWKLGVESVLINVLFENVRSMPQPEQFKLLQEQKSLSRCSEISADLLALRPFVYDIIGGLAAHCAKDLNFETIRNDHLTILIIHMCLAFVDPLQRNEPACRAVLLMVYSPNKYISSQTQAVLAEKLKPNFKDDIICRLNSINAAAFGDESIMLDGLRIVTSLISLACYSALSQCRQLVAENHGIKILSSFILRWLRNPVHFKSYVASHLMNCFNLKTCCFDREQHWEGEESFLLFGLWGLAELLHHFGPVNNQCDVLDCHKKCIESQLVTELEEILVSSYASGPKWFAACILSYFGIYGFPTVLGRKIRNSFSDNEFTDVTINLASQQYLSVHGVIFKVRCPTILSRLDHKLVKKEVEMNDGVRAEVRLSSRVDHQAFLKLLEYVYCGYLHAEEEFPKKMRSLAKQCDLQLLYQMLCRRLPKWGAPIPRFDLVSALGPTGYHFSDVVLQAEVNNLAYWKCEMCLLSVPHLHAHKIVLISSCEYLRAVFCSGMQESLSKTIKVQASWEALVKLVGWFYSGELQKPVFGCLWENLKTEAKLKVVEPYVELYSLTDSWLLQELHEECSRIIISCLNSSMYLSLKTIQLAAKSFQWDLVEVAAKQVAPSFSSLRESGELEGLDEVLVDIIRAASVKLSQEGCHHYS